MKWTLRDLFRYGKGIIVKRYNTGERITVTADITANHKGYFEFPPRPPGVSNKDNVAILPDDRTIPDHQFLKPAWTDIY